MRIQIESKLQKFKGNKKKLKFLMLRLEEVSGGYGMRTKPYKAEKIDKEIESQQARKQ